MNIRTHYDNLKVARNAPQEVIRAAYKSLSQKHHPDRNGNSAESQRVMKIINESYAVLSDPHARRKHDDWIIEQESSDITKEHSQGFGREFKLSPIKSGEIDFYDLDEETKIKIKEIASGRYNDTVRIKLDGAFWNYIWCFVLSGWFYYINSDAVGYRWDDETTYWHAGITAFVVFLLTKNIYWLYAWHSRPLKSWLVVTPLYLIKLHLDKISYWPIWTISNIQATHNYRNGFYQDTTLLVDLDGKRKIFSISSKSLYEQLIYKLQEYEVKFRSALNTNEQAYIVRHDHFLPIRENPAKKSERKSSSKQVIYILIPLMSFGFFWINYQTNLEKPFKPTYSKIKIPYNNNPQGQQKFVRSKTAPNGASWPSDAAYVEKYAILNTEVFKVVVRFSRFMLLPEPARFPDLDSDLLTL